MDKVFGTHGANFTIGEEAGQRNGAMDGLNRLGVMVGFAVEAFASAAAAHQKTPARAYSTSRCYLLEHMIKIFGRGLRIAYLKLQCLTHIEK